MATFQFAVSKLKLGGYLSVCVHVFGELSIKPSQSDNQYNFFSHTQQAHF